jgi:hypothetical protein
LLEVVLAWATFVDEWRYRNDCTIITRFFDDFLYFAQTDLKMDETLSIAFSEQCAQGIRRIRTVLIEYYYIAGITTSDIAQKRCASISNERLALLLPTATLRLFGSLRL